MKIEKDKFEALFRKLLEAPQQSAKRLELAVRKLLGNSYYRVTSEFAVLHRQ